MKAGEMKVVVDKAKKLFEAMKVLSSEVYVGIPEATGPRKEEAEEHMNNATLGYIHENGSDLANIPPRPHLIPGIKLVEDQVAEEFKKAAQIAFDNPAQAMKFYERAGIIAENSVKKVITEQMNFEPLSETTLRMRKANGFKGEKALLRTGQYRNSITHVIAIKGSL